MYSLVTVDKKTGRVRPLNTLQPPKPTYNPADEDDFPGHYRYAGVFIHSHMAYESLKGCIKGTSMSALMDFNHAELFVLSPF
jgi:hypothetical protein